MLRFLNRAGRSRRSWLVGLLVVILATLALAGTSSAGGQCPAGMIYLPPEGPCVKVFTPAEDTSCDYGRNPEALWPDNPDGHPFERAFCDGLTEDQYKHPLDSLENEDLYCDEVPGCWAYGMTQPVHH